MEAHSASGSVLTSVTHMVLLQGTDETSVLEWRGRPTHGMTLWTKGCWAASACHAPGTVVENSGGMLFSQISVSSARPGDHMCLPQYVMLIPSVTLVCCHSPWQYPWLPSLLLPGLVADAISPQHSHTSHKHGLRWTGIQLARAWLGLRDRGYEGSD